IVNTEGRQQPDVVYTAARGNVTVFFRRTGVSYVFAKKEQRAGTAPAHAENPAGTQEHLVTHRVDLELTGTNPHATILPSGRISEYFNYYYPHCPQGIHAVP